MTKAAHFSMLNDITIDKAVSKLKYDETSFYAQIADRLNYKKWEQAIQEKIHNFKEFFIENDTCFT